MGKTVERTVQGRVVRIPLDDNIMSEDYAQPDELPEKPRKKSQTPKLQFTSFVNAKDHIKRFSYSISDEVEFDKVPSVGGLFGLGDHKVTGDELNKVTTQTQQFFIKDRSYIKDIIDEFLQIYNALESLDQEYIPAILTALMNAEKASDQAKRAADHVKKTQQDLKKTVDEQKKIIKVLQKHKEELDQIKHIDSVDELWECNKKHQYAIEGIIQKLTENSEHFIEIEDSISSLREYAESLMKIEHLKDVDTLWDKAEDFEVRFENWRKQIKDLTKNLDVLSQKLDRILKQEHILDFDQTWSEVHSQKEAFEKFRAESEIGVKRIDANIDDLLEFRKQLNTMEHLPDIDRIWDRIDETDDSIKGNLEKENERFTEQGKMIEELQTTITSMKQAHRKMMTIAFVIGGTGVALSITSILLCVMRVI